RRRWPSARVARSGLPLAAARTAGRSPEVGGSFRGVPLFKAIVRPDDPRDELVAHDVAVVEVDHRDALDVAEDLSCQDESALLAGQVDLGDVAGDDGLRAEPETREEQPAHLSVAQRGDAHRDG